jgi:hypothetical protein
MNKCRVVRWVWANEPDSAPWHESHRPEHATYDENETAISDYFGRYIRIVSDSYVIDCED